MKTIRHPTTYLPTYGINDSLQYLYSVLQPISRLDDLVILEVSALGLVWLSTAFMSSTAASAAYALSEVPFADHVHDLCGNMLCHIHRHQGVSCQVILSRSTTKLRISHFCRLVILGAHFLRVQHVLYGSGYDGAKLLQILNA